MDLNLKFSVFEAGTKWKYAVHVSLITGGWSSVFIEIHDWCAESFDKDEYCGGSGTGAILYFLTEQQRTLFLLRWS